MAALRKLEKTLRNMPKDGDRFDTTYYIIREFLSTAKNIPNDQEFGREIRKFLNVVEDKFN